MKGAEAIILNDSSVFWKAHGHGSRGRKDASSIRITIVLILLLLLLSGVFGSWFQRSNSVQTSLFHDDKTSVAFPVASHRINYAHRGNVIQYDSDVVVERGDVLTLEANSTICLGEGVNILVKGHLEVAGESGAVVYFLPMDVDLPWGSIIVETTGSATIRNAVMSGATYALVSNNTSIHVENVTISNSNAGMFFFGRCSPLIRNVSMEDVVDGIGMKGLDNAPSRIISMARPEGYGNGSLMTFNDFVLSSAEIESRVGKGDIRLSFYYGEPVYEADPSFMEINGERRSITFLPYFPSGIPSGLFPNPGLVPDGIDGSIGGIDGSIELSAFQKTVDSYMADFRKDMVFHPHHLQTGWELPVNMIPSERHMVLDVESGLKEGVNSVSIDHIAHDDQSSLISLVLEYVPSARGVFDNITITRATGWGVYLSSAAPLFMGLHVYDVGQHVVLKDSSHPIFLASEFDGRNGDGGFVSEEEGNTLSMLYSRFSYYSTSAVDMKGGVLVLVGCIFDNMLTTSIPVINVEMGPSLGNEFIPFSGARPSVICGSIFFNIPSRSLYLKTGLYYILNSTFESCGNGIYFGTGTKGSVMGNSFSNISYVAIFAYECVDRLLDIGDNTFYHIKGGGIVVKETSLSIYCNNFTGCGGMPPGFSTDIDNKFISTDLFSGTWTIFIEKGTATLHDNELVGNPCGILAGVDAHVSLSNDDISHGEYFGLAGVSTASLVLLDSSILYSGGYDMVVSPSCDMTTINTALGTKAELVVGLERETHGDDIYPFIILFVILSVVLIIVVRVIILFNRQKKVV